MVRPPNEPRRTPEEISETGRELSVPPSAGGVAFTGRRPSSGGGDIVFTDPSTGKAIRVALKGRTPEEVVQEAQARATAEQVAVVQAREARRERLQPSVEQVKGQVPTGLTPFEEAADLIYHLLVLLAYKDITLADIEKELEKRHIGAKDK